MNDTPASAAEAADRLSAFADTMARLLGSNSHINGLPGDPVLMLADLRALLDEREQQGTPRTQYGVRYPDLDTVSVAPGEACARVWVEQYADVLRNVDPRFAGARVQRRTVTRTATGWEDVDDSAGEEGAGDG